VATVDDKWVHIGDRIGNKVEVFKTHGSLKREGSYSLTSSGACGAASITDDPNLLPNDPAPDLMSRSPNGDYLFVALRGPIPITAPHGAQGSCPGVGVIELTQGGKSGTLVTVLRATNVLDTATAAVPGGQAYVGAERADVHFVDVRVLDE
jgi:hypothetical protein